VATLTEHLNNRALRHGRTCYSHLAGQLGVSITQAITTRGFIVHEGDIYTLTEAGAAWLNNALDLGVSATAGHLRFGRTCLDWSERVPHLAGRLGVAICEALFARRWISRRNDPRAVQITPAGRRGFFGPLGIA
jgi:hypothetical protein